MARPSKFDSDRGRVILGALIEGRGRRAAAESAGVGLRTLAGWLARGRAGDPAFSEWARLVGVAEGVANRGRCDARYERETAAAKERWRRFKAAREAWHLDKLGPSLFWSRRLKWLAARGHTRAFAATVARLEAEGFRISSAL